MAFMKNLNDLKGILTLVVLTLQSIAANIDCNGRPFHCVNSTHFMICVDLGSGVSSTIDDFVIPCPPTTVCQGNNRFECEFPTVTTMTVTPSVELLVTSDVETTPFNDVATSIPFEEYYNTVSTTTLSGDVLLAMDELDIVTESILPVAENINVILSESASVSTLSETVPSEEMVPNDTTIRVTLPNNKNTMNTEAITAFSVYVNSTESDSYFNETFKREDSLPLFNNIDTTVSDINTEIPEHKSKSSLSKTIQNVVQNGLTRNYTSSSTSESENVAPIPESILTEVSERNPSISYLTIQYIPSKTALSNNIPVDIVTENINITNPINNTTLGAVQDYVTISNAYLPRNESVTENIVNEVTEYPKLSESHEIIKPLTINDINNAPSTKDAAEFLSNTVDLTIEVNLSNLQENTPLIEDTKTESVTSDNVLILLNKSTMDNFSTTDSYMTEVTETMSTGYQGFSTEPNRMNSNTVLDITPNSILSMTVQSLPKKFQTSTYNTGHYKTDTEKIGNNHGLLTNQTNGKPVASEKVVSTGSTDNLTTKHLIINDTFFIGSPVLATDEPVLNLLTTAARLSPNTDTSTSIPNNKSNKRTDKTLELETNDVLPSKILDSIYKSFETNISNSELLATSVKYFTTTESYNESIHNTADQFVKNTNADTATESTFYNNIMFSTTNSAANDLPFSDIVTELSIVTSKLELSTTVSTYSTLDILPNENTVVEVSSPTIDIIKEFVTRATSTPTSTTITDLLNNLGLSEPADQHSIKDATDINTESNIIVDGNEIVYRESPIVFTSNNILAEKDYQMDLSYHHNTELYTSYSASNETIKENVVTTENITVSHTIVPEFYRTAEVITVEVENQSNVKPSIDVGSGKGKFKLIFSDTHTTMSSSSADNFQTAIMPVSNVTQDIKTSTYNVSDLELNINSISAQSTNLLNTALKGKSNTFDPESVSNISQVPVQDSSTTEEIVPDLPESLSTKPADTIITNTLDVENSVMVPVLYSTLNQISDENTIYKENNVGTPRIDLKTIKENNPLENLLLNSITAQALKKESHISSTSNTAKPEQDISIPAASTNVNEVSTKYSTNTLTPTEAYISSTQQETYTESTTATITDIIQSLKNFTDNTHSADQNNGTSVDISTATTINIADIKMFPSLITTTNDVQQVKTLKETSQTNEAAGQGAGSGIVNIEIPTTHDIISTEPQSSAQTIKVEQTSTPSIATEQTIDHVTIPVNTGTREAQTYEKTYNEGTMQDGLVINEIKPSIFTIIEAQWSHEVSTDLDPLATVNQAPDKTIAGPTAESWTKTVVKVPSSLVISPITYKQTLIDVATTGTYMELISSPETGFLNGPCVTNPSINQEQPALDVTSTVSTTKIINKTSKVGNQVPSEHINTTPKRESYHDSIIAQKADTVTTPHLDTNPPDTNVVLNDIIKPVQATVTGGTDDSNHSVNLAIPKPPIKSMQSEQLEERKSVENPESREEKESGYQSIAKIDQLSSTEKPAHVVSPNLKDKSVQNESIVTANIVSDNTNFITGTARYNTQTQLTTPMTNTYNAFVPTFESTTTTTLNFVCKANSRGRFSDSIDCSKFYICIGKSEPIQGTCPNNTVFSEFRKLCTKNLSHCVRNKQFQCVSEGRFSDFLKDSIYYICAKNNVGRFIRFKLQCQSGYHLNKTSVRCVLNTDSSQSTSQQSTDDVSKDSNQSVSAITEKAVQESNKTNQFECEKEGKFPDAIDCRKYYICRKIGKSKYRQKCKKCDGDELFHRDKKKCVDADSYECT